MAFHPQPNWFPLTIIGAGPAGLYGAYYAGLRGTPCQIFESSSEIGGKLTALYPDKWIYDVPGFPQIKAQELIENLWKQCAPFAPQLHLNAELKDLEPQELGWKIRINDSFHWTQCLILATGGGAYKPQPHPCEDLLAYEGKGVQYHIKEEDLKGIQNPVVIGGGNSALDWWFFLKERGFQPQLIHRSERFRAHESQVALALKERENLWLNSQIVGATGSSTLQSLTLQTPQGCTTLSCDLLIVALGTKQTPSHFPSFSLPDPIPSWHLGPRLYGIGEGFPRAQEVHLIVTGFADAAQAVNHAHKVLHPQERLQPIYSTTLMKKHLKGKA